MREFKKTKLQKIILEMGGPDAVGKKLKCSGFAVRYWIRGECAPSWRHVIALYDLAAGKLTFKDIIYGSTWQVRGEI